ncbi:unnamed protein product [Symbiodinium natans]|uniref:Uncharacterized protein n=1 Tax=Symbiodinium natans TaxID=878477 RepID=A0A812I218_9DINO|nr:unnamed protein product [Symbiodinium natans]
MIAAAWTWAANTKNLRRNPVHGEEEAKLVLSDQFEALDKTTHETGMEGDIDIEDDSGFLFENDLPDIEGNDASLMSGEIDQCSRCSSAGAAHLQWLKGQIDVVLEKMRNLFRQLSAKQSDSLTASIDKFWPFSDSLLQLFAETTKQDLVMNNYVVRAKAIKTGGARSVAPSAKPAAKGKNGPKEKIKEKKDRKVKKDKPKRAGKKA